MQKLIYAALLPLLINSVTASDDNSREDKANGSLHGLSVHVAGSPTRSDDDRTPETNSYSSTEIDSPYSPDLYDLASLARWSKKGCRAADDSSPDVMELNEHPLFMSCASLLAPYMKKHRSMHNEAERTGFNQALTRIAEDFKSIVPTERYKIAQQLNILAMFKGELTFVKIKGKGRNKICEQVRCTLADRFRIGKNRRKPMQMQCSQIESGVITAEEASLTLYESWKTEGALDKIVKSCRKRLRSNGFYRYQWPYSELVDLLTYRAENPRVVEKSKYDENKIKKFVKRIKKKGRNKKKYIDDMAQLIAAKWTIQGKLDKGIEDCVVKLDKAKAKAKENEMTSDTIFDDAIIHVEGS